MDAGRNGFTLVETIVSISIIGILTVLAVSVTRSVGTTRQQMVSVARLRQWGAAMVAYATENGGDIPRRGQGVQPVTRLDRPEDWFNALPPFLGEAAYGELVKAGRRPRENAVSIFIRPGAKDPGGAVFLGYAMNMNLSPWNLPTPTRLFQIEHPGRTVFLAESPGDYASTYPSARPFGCLAPHGGKGNILFLDGHVAAFDGAYLGVGNGDPGRDDVRWLTGTQSDAQAGNYR